MGRNSIRCKAGLTVPIRLAGFLLQRTLTTNSTTSLNQTLASPRNPRRQNKWCRWWTSNPSMGTRQSRVTTKTTPFTVRLRLSTTTQRIMRTMPRPWCSSKTTSPTKPLLIRSTSMIRSSNNRSDTMPCSPMEWSIWLSSKTGCSSPRSRIISWTPTSLLFRCSNSKPVQSVGQAPLKICKAVWYPVSTRFCSS